MKPDPQRSDEFLCRWLMHAGEGPAHPRSEELVMGVGSSREAAELAAPALYRFVNGEDPTFSDEVVHVEVEDWHGAKRVYTVRCEFIVKWTAAVSIAPAAAGRVG